MGCGCGKGSPEDNYPAITDMAALEPYSRFEHSFPFYRTRVDFFEGRVKRLVDKKSSVSLKQLRYAFKDDAKWEDL